MSKIVKITFKTTKRKFVLPKKIMGELEGIELEVGPGTGYTHEKELMLDSLLDSSSPHAHADKRETFRVLTKEIVKTLDETKKDFSRIWFAKNVSPFYFFVRIPNSCIKKNAD